MPELPEVETVCRQLHRNLAGATIKSVDIEFAKKISPRDFASKIRNRKIISVKRRAKVIIIKLSGDFTLLAHLKMTGKLFLKPKNTKPDKHTHAIFHLTGKYDLHWHDVRKFGWLKLMANKEAEQWFVDQDFGPEPLDPKFTFDKFDACLQARAKTKIKPLLLQQTCLAGIGNIYAAESLWRAKINPQTITGKIDEARRRELFRAIKSILAQAIKARGTSAGDFLDSFGQPGEYEKRLKVYHREGQRCGRCGAILKNLRIGGRSTIYCPKCQPK